LLLVAGEGSVLNLRALHRSQIRQDELRLAPGDTIKVSHVAADESTSDGCGKER